MQRRTGSWHRIFLLVITLSLLIPVLQLGAHTVAASSPGGSRLTTFYLHDDGAGIGHAGKRFDWANTTIPYNPLNPNFISPTYQGIELNSSGIQQSFRWIAWPAVNSSVTLSGDVNVTLYMTQTNSSAGSIMSFNVQLQDGTSVGVPAGVLIAQATSSLHLAPDEKVTLTLPLAGSYVLASGHMLILNISRTDSNSATSVYVGFDYNSSPSSFSVSLTPRLGPVALTVPQQISDGTSFTVLANATDSLGSQDVTSAYATVTTTAGQVVVNQSPMLLYLSKPYQSDFSYTGQLPYGSYTLNISVLSSANLTGSYQFSYVLAALTVNPSLNNFSVSIPASVTAGKDFTALFTAYSDSGGVMTGFNGSALIHALYPNSSLVPASKLATREANFTSGYASVNEGISVSGNLTLVVSNGTSTGSAGIAVLAAPVNSIMVSPPAVSLDSGQQLQFTATGYDVFGNKNTTWTPYWNSSGGSGTVTQGGLFLATRNGTCTVTARDNSTGTIGVSNVSVSPSSLFRLEVTPVNSTLLAGQTYFFSASGFDFFGNPVSLSDVVWETNAGTIFPNGSVAMLNATRSTMTGGWVEAFAGGISAASNINVVASASSPQSLLQIPTQIWPAGGSWSINLTSFFSNPNDPTDSGLEWFLAGGENLLYSYGSGLMGNSLVVLLPYGSAFGTANLTLTVRNSLGYSVTENFVADVLPRPSWSASLPLYMTVPADSYYSLNFTYFLNTTPFPGSAISVTTSSPYVYSSGLQLTYYFPQSFLSHSVPIVITATNPDNVSSSVVQVITVGSSTPPSVNTASAPPSSITIGRGDNVTLEYPLETYFLSQDSLTFSVAATAAVAHIAPGNTLFIVVPSSGTSTSGSLLILAKTASGEYAFLKIDLKIVSAVKPPQVKQLPSVYVKYSQTGSPNYSIPLLPYVTDSYVPISQISVITGVTYITFNSGNFSLLFSLPAFNPTNGSGQGNYTGPYWYNTTILVIGGPLQNLNQVSASVPLSVHVSSIPPPSTTRGKQLPTFITIPENSVYDSLNLSHYISSPQGERLSYSSLQQGGLGIAISAGGLVTVTPQSYYTGNSTVEFIANSSSGFFEFSLLVMVYPVYIPPVINTPSTITLASSSSVVNLSKFISNPNGEPLVIEAFGKGVTVVGDQMLVVLPSGVSKETITLVFISPVGSSTARQITVSLVSQFPSLYVILFYLLLAVMIAVGAALTYQRLIPKPFQLNSVLLIHNDGRLISHSHSRDYSGIDRDILVGMFTAIQDFVSTSFPEVGGERQTLNRIELGRFSIFVERGTSSFILSIYTGQPPRNWPQEVGAVLARIERTYPLLSWDGKQDSVAGVEDILNTLFHASTSKE